jgi:hypothetical protein
MEKDYQISFSPFVVNADLQNAVSYEKGFLGHFANSFIPRSGMNRKNVNARFNYNNKFCIDKITSRILSMPVPGETGIIPVCATKSIKKGDEIIVKYCGGTTGYLIKSSINVHQGIAKIESQSADNARQSAIYDRDERAKRRRIIKVSDKL